MPKINVKAYLHNKNENKFFNVDTLGILLDNKIKYIDNEVVTTIKINDDFISMHRTSDEYDIYLDFSLNKKTKGKYFIKSLGDLDLEVETILLIQKESYIEIEYNMIIQGETRQRFNYKIEYGGLL